MERWVGKIAIVTGASVGIGEAIARAFVGAGLQVVGLARREENVQKIADSLKSAKGKLYPVKCDLRNETEILNAFEWANKQFGGVDVLVNNAGLVSITSASEGSSEDYRNILDVNVLAVAICTREAMKSMRTRGVEGHLFYVSSVMGYEGAVSRIPTNIYPASKFAIRGLVESIKFEIETSGDNIRTTNIIPGLVNTEIYSAGGGPADGITKRRHIQPKDISDGVMYALSAAPGVRVDEVRITPFRNWD